MSSIPQSGSEHSGLAPVLIEIKGDHPYKNRGAKKSGCGFQLADGTSCMKAMTHSDHLFLPLSLNVALAGHIRSYRGMKEAWQSVITAELEASGLPAGWRSGADAQTTRIRRISAEVEVCFPVRKKERDQGNFRWFVEKCLGDALDEGGWIEDDSYFPDKHFDVGALEMLHRPGEAWTRIVLLPS